MIRNYRLPLLMTLSVVIVLGVFLTGVESSNTVKQLWHKSPEVISGDPMVEPGLIPKSVDEATVEKICTPYYETTVYDANGVILKKYITVSEPICQTYGQNKDTITIEEFRAKMTIYTNGGVTCTVTKKSMPIGWLVNSMGEYSYESRRVSHYNHYLESKRSLAPSWDESWWELMK